MIQIFFTFLPQDQKLTLTLLFFCLFTFQRLQKHSLAEPAESTDASVVPPGNTVAISKMPLIPLHSPGQDLEYGRDDQAHDRRSTADYTDLA